MCACDVRAARCACAALCVCACVRGAVGLCRCAAGREESEGEGMFAVSVLLFAPANRVHQFSLRCSTWRQPRCPAPPPPSLRRLRADEEHKRTSTNTCGLASAIDDDQLRANFPDKEISKRGACERERASMVRGEELSPTGHGGHGWVWLRCEC
jgi:hypothetical protein